MSLTSTELDLLEQLASGTARMSALAPAIGKSKAQLYRAARALEEKGFATRSRGRLVPSRQAFTSLLLRLLLEFPNLKPLLADSGIPVLTAALTPSTASEIEKRTGLAKSAVYLKLQEAGRISVVRKQGSAYVLNELLWGTLRRFLAAYEDYQKSVDRRVPLGSTIYYRTEKEIVFSSRRELDAAPTAFSAFRQHGIRLSTHVYYYCLPKRKLSMAEVFRHTLRIVEKEKTIHNLILLALYFAKHRKSLRIQHPLVEGIKLVLRGQRVEGYPAVEEIKERAEVYDIEL